MNKNVWGDLCWPVLCCTWSCGKGITTITVIINLIAGLDTAYKLVLGVMMTELHQSQGGPHYHRAEGQQYWPYHGSLLWQQIRAGHYCHFRPTLYCNVFLRRSHHNIHRFCFQFLDTARAAKFGWPNQTKKIFNGLKNKSIRNLLKYLFVYYEISLYILVFTELS